jgi:hypothetical protein
VPEQRAKSRPANPARADVLVPVVAAAAQGA